MVSQKFSTLRLRPSTNSFYYLTVISNSVEYLTLRNSGNIFLNFSRTSSLGDLGCLCCSFGVWNSIVYLSSLKRETILSICFLYLSWLFERHPRPFKSYYFTPQLMLSSSFIRFDTPTSFRALWKSDTLLFGISTLGCAYGTYVMIDLFYDRDLIASSD